MKLVAHRFDLSFAILIYGLILSMSGCTSSLGHRSQWTALEDNGDKPNVQVNVVAQASQIVSGELVLLQAGDAGGRRNFPMKHITSAGGSNIKFQLDFGNSDVRDYELKFQAGLDEALSRQNATLLEEKMDPIPLVFSKASG
jgi:hypothetical protein